MTASLTRRETVGFTRHSGISSTPPASRLVDAGGTSARQQPVEGGAHRVDVGPGGEVGLSRVLLGRGVAGRDDAGHRHGVVVEGPGQAEVDEHDATVVGPDQVGRADVAVQHPGAVDRLEGAGQLGGDVQRLGLRQRTAPRRQLRGEGPPTDPLEDDVGRAALLEDGVDPHDRRMPEAGQGRRLAEEPLPGPGERGGVATADHHGAAVPAGRRREQLLDRHGPVEAHVDGVVGDGEATPAERRTQPVAAAVELGAGRERPAGVGRGRPRVVLPIGGHRPLRDPERLRGRGR